MMMMRTAGGPPIAPLDFNERPTRRVSRHTWIALGIVGVAHAALLTALYYQRFELKAPPPAPVTTTEGVIIELPRPVIPPKTTPTKPQPKTAPATRTNDTPAPTTNQEVLQIPSGDTVPTGPTVNFEKAPEISTEGAPPAADPPREPPVITRPSWQRQPSADQLIRAYPDRAQAAGIGGSVTLNCLVEANGRVSDCGVVRETPSGQGFARAAQNLSRYFQMNPRTVDGAAEGARVNVTLRFDPPRD